MNPNLKSRPKPGFWDLEPTPLEVIPPVWGQFGTTWHYTIDNGQPKFGQQELLDKNRKSVAFYRMFSPIVATVDEDLIKVFISCDSLSWSIQCRAFFIPFSTYEKNKEGLLVTLRMNMSSYCCGRNSFRPY